MIRPRIIAAHALANAILLGLGYYWLGVSESTTSGLLFSFSLALVIVALTSVVYGAAVAQFAAFPMIESYRQALRNLLPMMVCSVLIAFIYWILANWSWIVLKPAFPIASWLTLKLQKPVKPNSVARIFSSIFWLIKWVIVPVLIVPLVGAVANNGWRGFRLKPQIGIRSLQIPFFLLAMFWLPLTLIYWVPVVHGFPAEVGSLVARAALAYLLFIGAGLLLARSMSVGRPAEIHVMTAPSP